MAYNYPAYKIPRNESPPLSSPEQFPTALGNAAPTPIRPAIPQGGGSAFHPPMALPPEQAPAQAPAPEVTAGQQQKIIADSAEAVKTASDADKKAMNEAIEGMGMSVEDAYKEAMEALGGEQSMPKMDRKDWGMFIMDLGMRMTVASQQEGANVASAFAGGALGAISNQQQQRATLQGNVDERNSDMRDRAQDIAETRVERYDDNRALLDKRQARGEENQGDPKNIIWTEKGAFNTRTGTYQKDPAGGVLQPGMAPGGSNRPYQSQLAARQLRESMMASGMSEQDAKVFADRISYGGAPDPAKLYVDLSAAFDKTKNGAGITAKVPGTQIRWRDADETIKREWIETQINDYMGFVTGSANAKGGGGALTQPGPASAGRRPRTMDGYK